MSRIFLESYLATAGGAGFLPADAKDFALLLDAYLLDKAVYEVAYELNNRPDWIRVPLRGIVRILDAKDEGRPTK
jgi:maltose alpha-D-glucosyltransferase/alpha-amylase